MKNIKEEVWEKYKEGIVLDILNEASKALYHEKPITNYDNWRKDFDWEEKEVFEDAIDRAIRNRIRTVNTIYKEELW